MMQQFIVTVACFLAVMLALGVLVSIAGAGMREGD